MQCVAIAGGQKGSREGRSLVEIALRKKSFPFALRGSCSFVWGGTLKQPKMLTLAQNV